MSINQVTISGNLTRDPELRSTGSGMSVLKFSVAVNDRVKNSQGEWEDYPNYVDCAMFGKRAESLANHLMKGTKVAIEGKLRYSKWQDKDGSNRSKLEVVVDELEFMSGQQNRQQQAPQHQAPQYQQAPQYAPQMAPQQGYAPPMQQMPQQMPQYQQPAYMPQQAPLYDEDIPF